MSPANPESRAHDKAGVRLPPRLYVNQLVSSKATWAEMNLRVTMQADMFTPGEKMHAAMQESPLG